MGEIGHVEDFIVDDETWAIRYLIVNTSKLVGRQTGSWFHLNGSSASVGGESKVFVNLTREAIKESPEYTDASELTRDYEIGLHIHYNRQGYWLNDRFVTHHSYR